MRTAAKRRTILLVMLAAALWCAGPHGAGATISRDWPQITDCRIGFDDHYKVGYWTPIWVDVERASELKNARIEVTTIDSDGVETIVAAPVATDLSSHTHLLYIKIGRINAPIHVSLITDGQEVDQKALDPTVTAKQMPVLDALPAISELVVSLGGHGTGLTDAFADREPGGGAFARRVVEIDDVAALPDEWIGYAAVDLLVLSANDAELCRALSSDEKRLGALRRWVELGGRIVVLAGGAQAEELFGGGSPLASLLPGRLTKTVRTGETTTLEQYADTNEPISGPGTRAELEVPRLVDARGTIEAYIGPRPTALPIVVRGPLGLGEAAFAGLALAEPPLDEWKGRSAFWRALLRPYIADVEDDAYPQMLGTLGYNDLSGALRQRMGRSFTGVTPVPFLIVAILSIAYMLLLGPASYWIAHQFGGRPGLAWVIFPVLVLSASGGAYMYNQETKGDGSRVNQLELVDCDQTTGQARGTYWAVIYSPESERFDLALDVRSPARKMEGTDAAGDPAESRAFFSWWGLPGVGIGGMQTSGMNLAAIDASYHFAPTLDALEGVPILTSSTKSFSARWTAPIGRLIDAELADDDGMLVGWLANQSGKKLASARLLYGTWAYRLDDLADGERVEVGQHLDPIKIQTLVRQMARGSSATSYANRGQFLAERATTD